MPQFAEEIITLSKNQQPSIEHLEEISYTIRSYTGLPLEICQILLQTYF